MDMYTITFITPWTQGELLAHADPVLQRTKIKIFQKHTVLCVLFVSALKKLPKTGS